jgi:transcriptional regulator with XRE-family HTH domain
MESTLTARFHPQITPSLGQKTAIAVYREVNGMRTLSKLLDSTGLPRYRIAREAGMSYSTLLLWERHGIPPKRIDVYTRLAQVLGVEPRELLALANGGDTRE